MASDINDFCFLIISLYHLLGE